MTSIICGIIDGYHMQWFSPSKAFTSFWMLFSQNSHAFLLFFWIILDIMACIYIYIYIYIYIWGYIGLILMCSGRILSSWESLGKMSVVSIISTHVWFPYFLSVILWFPYFLSALYSQAVMWCSYLSYAHYIPSLLPL